eukprot:comp19026_c0_seq1/m.21421 comp19026_c0_seq1/g.21421  ORF comp19026_c0_seq1/g.21421 comp19026_c0_seq1/m.21421 type:complete len:233 (-) comp19026_c0_seq1:282-980(-)
MVSLQSSESSQPWAYNMRRDMQEVLPGIFLGPYAAAKLGQLPQLEKAGITHIVCIREPQEAPFVRCNFEGRISYLVIEVHDSPGENIIHHFPRFRDFVNGSLSQGGRVLVHGNAGISRSAALLIAYVMERNGMGYDEAYLMVQSRRFCINPNEGFCAQLSEYEPIYKARQMVQNNQANRVGGRDKRGYEPDEEDGGEVYRQAPPNPFEGLRRPYDEEDDHYGYEQQSAMMME